MTPLETAATDLGMRLQRARGTPDEGGCIEALLPVLRALEAETPPDGRCACCSAPNLGIRLRNVVASLEMRLEALQAVGDVGPP